MMHKKIDMLLIYFLCFISLVVNIKNVLASDIKNGDLVKANGSSAVYLIQNGERLVFPHSSVYLSWGYPENYSTVKTISKEDLISYPLAGAAIYRDGLVFRFSGTSMPGGFDPSAVFFVSDGKVRPIDSAATYMKLFNAGVNDKSAWDKVYWIPKDLLENFTYPKGDVITSEQIDNGDVPNGLVVKIDNKNFGIVRDGELQQVSSSALRENRYTTNIKIFNKLLAKLEDKVLSKLKKGKTISSKDDSLLNLKSIDVTMLPPTFDDNNTSNTNTGTNTGSGSSGSSSSSNTSVINTTPLTPTDVIPLSKPTDTPFSLVSVAMAADSDRVINITFNKDVQNNAAKNRMNYTFTDVYKKPLNSTTGGPRIDANGHPINSPVRSSDNNAQVTIILGNVNEYNVGLPSGTYQLCISNMKTATGGETLPNNTCKQFYVSNSIRPTLNFNSDELEPEVNYIASENKILLHYSKPMNSSAISASNYQIRNFISYTNGYGYGITSWVSISSINNAAVSYLGYGNKDVLISLPNSLPSNKVVLLNQQTDFAIGDLSNMAYVPKDANGNLFIENKTHTTRLEAIKNNSYGYGITVYKDGDSMLANDYFSYYEEPDCVDYLEVISPTQVALTFKRELSSVDASEFEFKNLKTGYGCYGYGCSGFKPVKAEIDSKNYKRAIFTVSSDNAFSVNDHVIVNDNDPYPNNNIYNVAFRIGSFKDASYGYGGNGTNEGYGDSYYYKTTNTKDVLGLPITFQYNNPNRYYDDENGGFIIYEGNDSWDYPNMFINDIKTSLTSFVVANPNTIYATFDGKIEPINSMNDGDTNYKDLANDLIIDQSSYGVYVNGAADFFKNSGFTSHSYGAMMIYNGGANQLTSQKYYRAPAYYKNDLVKILFSSNLNTNNSVTMKTVDQDMIKSINVNGMPLNSNTTGIQNSKFAAYNVDTGLYPYEYNTGYGIYDNNGITILLKSLSTNSSTQPSSFTILDTENAPSEYNIPCYSEQFDPILDYFSPEYYRIVNEIASHIKKQTNDYALLCDVDNEIYPVYLGLLKDSLESYYSPTNNIFKMDYPYHYKDNTIVPFAEIGFVDPELLYDGYGYYNIGSSYTQDNFLSIRFNKNINLNSLGAGLWTYGYGVSSYGSGNGYGIAINNSIFFDGNKNKITFNGINLGEFILEDNNLYNSSYYDYHTDLNGSGYGNALYTYDYDTNILTINLIKGPDQEVNIMIPDNNDYIDNLRYIPNKDIKDINGYGIDTSITPYINLLEY